MAYLIVAALAFGACYLIDRGFTKAFRDKAQHKSGLSVRHSKRYALFGVFLVVLGILGLITGLSQKGALLWGSAVVLAMGAALIGYYMAFGIYYDAESFLFSTLGRKSAVYRFSDIRAQKLYVLQGGSILVELHLTDGGAISLQSTMEGVYPFLDHAFAAWCRQTGRNPGDCPFYDPSQSKWFPDVDAEVE